MSQTFKGAINFPTNFDVQTTKPLDSRLVVDSVDDLTNGSISAPYQGMVVNIKGTSELWILLTQGIEESHNFDNWKLVTGSNGEIDESVIDELKESLGILTDLVGTPSEIDEPTGLFKEIDELKKSGISASFGYTIPVMTPEMAQKATEDPLIDFDGSDDPYIMTDFDMKSLEGEVTNKTLTSINGTYLDIMMRAIRDLQSEVARLKNSFDYGIDSYQNKRTAKSNVLSDYSDVEGREPLWAIDPGYLSKVEDSVNFNTYLDENHSFERWGDCTIDVSVDNQLTFKNGVAVFRDGDDKGDNLTLYNQKDSKQIVYLVTDKPTINISLISIDNKEIIHNINLEPYLKDKEVNTYGFCIVISRKVKSPKTQLEKGFNYVYFSIINYENDNKLYEGYWNPYSNDELSDDRIDLDNRYSISSLSFDRLTLYRMKFYTKFEDFSEEVITSAPSESDWKYDVAHITIRAVDNSAILDEVKDQLRENELIWNKKNGTLHIKSNGKIHLIGSNNTNNPENNNNDNMTDREIIDALHKMGIIVNVEYEKDANGDETDKILSLDNLSLSPISDFTFVNNETGKRFTYTIDTEGNLIGKDNSAETIEEFNNRFGTSEYNIGNPIHDKVKYDGSTTNFQSVRGFISDYLYRLSGEKIMKDGSNIAGDAEKKSDRLRFSSFYAPISTDTSHGCTHSFVELENTSEVDIPLKGMYLHFYNPVAINNGNGTYSGKVYHLALTGVIPAGGTYLIRGAKHAEFDDVSSFIKVRTFDQEWYENGQPLSFEQMPVKTEKGTDNSGKDVEVCAKDSKIKTAYRFCLTYGFENLNYNDRLVSLATGDRTLDGVKFTQKDFPNVILDPRFIDSCSFSTLASVSSQTTENPWYINGDSGVGITIVENSMFRLMFTLDPAKQAYNGFAPKDGSRIRYNKVTDIQILKLDKEFIGFPHSEEIIKIDRYTPKASFEHRNVMTDKTQLDFEKPNMVTCSFGNDVYNTRCFNWISCGVFDECVWIRKEGTNTWTKFDSYKNVDSDNTESTNLPRRKEYKKIVNNAVYARIIDRFPGNNVLFTSHKCVIVLPEVEGENPVKYEYVVGRPDKDGNPDMNHTNDVYTFTQYPRDYEGKVYQITDQQGFHWIEYQVWAASAEFLNDKIKSECEGKKVFPILINTGDMTQSGARINEWLDYYNGGKCLFNHMEQINCVGNNDLCDVNPRDLGTGNDNNKSNSRFFHYFYCFDVKDTEKYNSSSDEQKKFFSGESLVIEASGDVKEDKYIPSTYYFKTSNVLYLIVNSEIPAAAVKKAVDEKDVDGWFGLNNVNIYTGIKMVNNGDYDVTTRPFTPIYNTIYAWLNGNVISDSDVLKNERHIVVAMHEMPFTVITNESLTNSDATFLKSTRNHPNGKTARVGSNVNQLVLTENRGTYWMSRLLEYFGCKIVIGGHKHTYALSYPIKEKYSWSVKKGDGTYEDAIDSYTQIKPMQPTLEDEAGVSPNVMVNWSIDFDDDNPYSIDTDKLTKNDDRKLNSTKTPYIPKGLYNKFGYETFENSSGVIRCCTPAYANDKYDGFITYSMCQATGYKLKSNKELPSPLQLFSKIIPKTNVTESKPDGRQLYPMYSILTFNDDCSELDVDMVRINGIFKNANKDEFGQNIYGTGNLSAQYLCSLEKNDCKFIASSEDEMGTYLDSAKKGDYLYYIDDSSDGIDKMYVCDETSKTENGVTNTTKSWKIYSDRMYGQWVSLEKVRPDNRYLHIKF